jgi:hypothetical protein
MMFEKKVNESWRESGESGKGWMSNRPEMKEEPRDF